MHPIARTKNKEETDTASAGLRRLQRQSRSGALVRRALTGLSARNRPRSRAIASADAYRCAGSLAIAFRTIVSRSRGILRLEFTRGWRQLLGHALDQPGSIGLLE